MRVQTPPLWQSNERVLDAPGNLRVLTAFIAHEVNQPLSGIIANASTCLRLLSADRPNLDGVRETARRTLRDANRVADVVNRLRALFAGTPIATEPVDLNEAIFESLELMQSELDGHEVTVWCEVADGLPQVTGDYVALQQVIQNLVRNGVEAMDGATGGPRELTITARPYEGNRVLLTIRDAGIGFGREDAERLFAPFYTTKNRGMGIGLSVSRSIVEHHGGQLRGTPNEDGPGATFWLLLPRASARTSNGTPGALRLARANGALANADSV